ncbi:MAG: hypothetical protein Q8R65_01955 [Polynucleobacter sp.]|jgi:hypothetical protein|nr:hypothetical protein [Polynucleobacter sp.]
MKSFLRAASLVALSIGFLSACSDEPGTIAKNSKRPDIAPYMGADNGFMVKGWTPGNAQSWQEEINKRNQNQSEYSRIK